MTTPSQKTKLPLRAWKQLCSSISTLTESREIGTERETLNSKWEGIMGYIGALLDVGTITWDEYLRLSEAAFFAWTGKDSGPDPY